MTPARTIDHQPLTIDHRRSTIYSTCLHCTKDLGANDVIETLPIGRRLAFDASKGRLWVVCRHCAKWNLVPFETRLESIDACERIFRDSRTRFSTDQIGLAKVAEGLELVRIGEALRPEFASWRYGEQYRRRRRKAMVAGGVGAVAVGAGLAGLGAAGVALGSFGYFGFKIVEGGWKYGIHRMANVTIEHPRTSRPFRLKMATLKHAIISQEEGVPAFEVPLYSSTISDAVRWTGREFAQQGRRALGSLNLMAGKAGELRGATELLAENTGDLTQWLRGRAQAAGYLVNDPKLSADEKGPPRWGAGYAHPILRLSTLLAGERLAVEMWMNEDIERTWLEGELKLLEREWRDAERLAKIGDDLALDSDVSP